MQEPAVKRVVAFIDGQNLFYTAKAAGFCTTPDYDVYFLAHEVCRRLRVDLSGGEVLHGSPRL